MTFDLDHVQSWLFLAVAAALIAMLLMHLASRNRNTHSRFSFDALFVDPKTGETSPARVVLMGSFITSTLVVLYGAFIRSLSNELFIAYCATFAAPAIAKIITDAGIEKAAATPDPAPVQIDRQINMTAGDVKTPIAPEIPKTTRVRAAP